jgi:hypothetical protein
MPYTAKIHNVKCLFASIGAFLTTALKSIFKEDSKKMRVCLDTSRISTSSRLLQVSEFRFFQLAYVQWYGRDIPEQNLEYIFVDYIFKDEVPHWARHLARRVLSGYIDGSFDPKELNLNCTLPPRDVKSTGYSNVILLAVIYTLFFLILS